MTRNQMRQQYAELRQTASDIIMHELFPQRDETKIVELTARLHELCTPAMVLCLMDDIGSASTPRTPAMPPTSSRCWYCPGCGKRVGPAPHRCPGPDSRRYRQGASR